MRLRVWGKRKEDSGGAASAAAGPARRGRKQAAAPRKGAATKAVTGTPISLAAGGAAPSASAPKPAATPASAAAVPAKGAAAAAKPVPSTVSPAPPTAPAAPASAAGTGQRVRRKRKVAPPAATPRQALVSLGEQIRAARRRARPTERVGWVLFRDDVRRGRIIDLAGLALLVALTVALATSTDYQVQSVSVVNSTALTATQAAQLTGVVGMNIFLVDPAQVAARLRRAPFIKDAQVETRLPGQVLIHVSERRPNVVWVLIDNTPYLISDDGVVISQATTLEGYVVVYDKDTVPGTLHLGDHLERQDVITVAQQLYMKLPGPSGLHISQMEYQVAGGVTVVTDTGRRVRFGDGTALDTKIRVVTALVQDMAAQHRDWHLIDVRAPDRVAVTP